LCENKRENLDENNQFFYSPDLEKNFLILFFSPDFPISLLCVVSKKKKKKREGGKYIHQCWT